MKLNFPIYEFLFLIAAISCSEQIIPIDQIIQHQPQKDNLKVGVIGKKYYVAKTGSDSNLGTFASPFLTITKTCNVVTAGDSIFILAGTYHEQLVFTKNGTVLNPITIKNYKSQTVVIDGENTLPDSSSPVNHYGILVTIKGNYTTISGIEIKNSFGSGIAVSGTNCTLTNLNVHHNWGNGIFIGAINSIRGGDYGTIQYCISAYNNQQNINGTLGIWGAGISVGFVRAVGAVPGHFLIKGCTVHDDWGEGISTYGSDDTVLKDNISYDNWSASIYICNATNVECRRNFIYKTKNMGTGGGEAGIQMGDEWTTSAHTANVTISNNIISGCKRNFYYWGTVGTNALNNLKILNNTFVNSLKNNYNSNIAINTTIPAISVSIKNNIIVQDGTIWPINVINYTNFSLSNNLWSKSPNPKTTGIGDINNSDPKFVNNSSPFVAASYKLQSTSPAINKGISITGITYDYTGKLIVGIPDIGAYEY